MIINYKGLVEREISGKTIFFKFNMASITLLNDLQGVGLADFSKQLINPKFSTIANFMYAGAEIAYLDEGKNAKPNGSRDFSSSDGPEWLNEIGLEDSFNIFLKAFEVPESKKE